MLHSRGATNTGVLGGVHDVRLVDSALQWGARGHERHKGKCSELGVDCCMLFSSRLPPAHYYAPHGDSTFPAALLAAQQALALAGGAALGGWCALS